MSLGNLVAVVFGLAFGGALLMLSPAKAGAAMVGLAAAVTILRFPFWGLLLFALVATFMPYSTVNVGIRSTVSEAILALTWARCSGTSSSRACRRRRRCATAPPSACCCG